MSFFTLFAYSANTELSNAELMVRIDSANGSYAISTKGVRSPVVRAGIAAEGDHHWINSAEYPKNKIGEPDFKDAPRRGRQTTEHATAFQDRPDVIYTT